MKLHLPKRLFVALCAAATFIATNAAAQAETAPNYSGLIITWNNTNTQNPGDLAGGRYRITTYDAVSDTFTVTNDERTGWGSGSGAGALLISVNNKEDRNTLRFAAAEYGQTDKTPVFTFNPLVLAGIIVDEGAKGFSISSKDGGDRYIYLGNNNSTVAYSTINEDFSITKNSGNNISKVYMRGTQVIDVAAEKTYTIFSRDGIDIRGSITLQGGGTLKLSGATTLGCTIINDNSTVDFNGNVTLPSSLAAFETSGHFKDYSGNAANDGYAGALDYTIVKGGSYTGLSSVTWGGQSYDVNDGKIHVDRQMDKTHYHLNISGHSLNLKEELNHNSLLNKVTMASGTMLNIDTNFTGEVYGAGTAAVNIASGMVLTGTVDGVALSGAGTYALSTNSASLPSSVLLDSGWTGAVRISSTSEVKSLAASKLVNAESTSWIEFYGFKGYTDTWNATLAQNIILTKTDAAPAWELSAFAATLNTMVATGIWKGNGTFKTAGGNSLQFQAVEYQGDISGWTGAFEANASGLRRVTFSNDAKLVKASFKKTGGAGAFELVANTDVSFDEAVTADKLSINKSFIVTLKGETSIGTLNSEGSLVVNANTHTIAIGSGTIANTITLQSGTLSMTGEFDISGIAASTPPTYVGDGGKGIANGNGFKHTEGKVHVVDITAGHLSAATATFTYDAERGIGLDGNGDFNLAGSTDYSILYVNNNDGVSYSTAWDIAQAQVPAETIASVAMANNTTIYMDRESAYTTLKLNGNATVHATESTTIANVEGWSSHILTIASEGDGIVSLLPSTDIVISGYTMLDVQGKVTTKQITMNNRTGALKVAEGGTLTLEGSLTPTHGSVEIKGTAVIGGELDLSGNMNSEVQMFIGNHGAVTSNGMWMNKNATLILAQGGTYSTNNVRFTGNSENGSIDVANGEQIHYAADEVNTRITNLIMEALDNITIANLLTNVDIVTGHNSVTLNSNAVSVTVSNGGVYNQGNNVTVGEITVEDGGTIGNGVNISQARIEEDATCTYANGLTDHAVTFYKGQGPSAVQHVTVTNETGVKAAYTGIGQTGMTVTADTLGSDADIEVMVNNKVIVNNIYNLGEAVTITNIDTGALRSIENYGGQITLQNIGNEDLEITTMRIFDKVVAAYTGNINTTEATITISETLSANGGTLFANLTLMGGSTLNVNGGNDNALTLGSTLTLDTTTGLINLDNTTVAALEALALGHSLDLFKAFEGTRLEYGSPDYDGTWFDSIFVRTENVRGDYRVYANENSFGLTKVSAVPEPSTVTLSLLALAAMVSRRRRAGRAGER